MYHRSRFQCRQDPTYTLGRECRGWHGRKRDRIQETDVRGFVETRKRYSAFPMTKYVKCPMKSFWFLFTKLYQKVITL